MPEKATIERARRDKREGKAASTQAGEFVREEMHHIQEGKHGAKNRAQAVAIGLSKARRAGVDLPPPDKGEAKEKTRKSAASAYRKGQEEGPLARGGGGGGKDPWAGTKWEGRARELRGRRRARAHRR